MNANGQCLCGAVSFTARDIDPQVHVCHCSMCRRWTGGPSFSVDAKSVMFKGEEHLQSFSSSPWAERGFCKNCGSSLFYKLKEPNHYILNMGSFDDQTQFKVGSEIYIDDKPSGYAIAGDHARLTGEEFLASLQKQS